MTTKKWNQNHNLSKKQKEALRREENSKTLSSNKKVRRRARGPEIKTVYSTEDNNDY